MPGFDWTILAALMGLALLVVGCGILRAYGAFYNTTKASRACPPTRRPC